VFQLFSIFSKEQRQRVPELSNFANAGNRFEVCDSAERKT